MNKSVRRRIAEVELRIDINAAQGCDTCRHYPGAVIRDDAGNMSRPEICPDCGRDVPIFQILHIAGIPLDLL